MRLLEMIRSAGSISAAAKALGYSYKGAWDAVQALNNLFEQPLVTTRAGGAHGGPHRATALSKDSSLVRRPMRTVMSHLPAGARSQVPSVSLKARRSLARLLAER